MRLQEALNVRSDFHELSRASELLMSFRVPPESQLVPVFEYSNEEWVGLTALMLSNGPLTACKAYLQSAEGPRPVASEL